VLKIFNYEPPTLKIAVDDNTEKLGPTGPNKEFEILVKENKYILCLQGVQWMMYDENHLQAAQLFSHYYIASGNVIVTGLGFAVRENWLLKNPKVKSLTILERSQKLIIIKKLILFYLKNQM
jgi:hypothetical protein